MFYLVDSPQPPELKLSELKYVMENNTVNLSCSAEAPCPKQPPKISWSNIPESAHITTQLQEKPDKTQSVFSYITFKASYKDHKKNISCTATYTRNTPDALTVESIVMLRIQCKRSGVVSCFSWSLMWWNEKVSIANPVYVLVFFLKILQKKLTSSLLHLLVLMWLWPAKAKPVHQMIWTTPGTSVERRRL